MERVTRNALLAIVLVLISSCENDAEVHEAHGKVIGTLKCYGDSQGSYTVFGVFIETEDEARLLVFNLHPSCYGIDSSRIAFGTYPYSGNPFRFDYRNPSGDEITSHSCPPTNYDKPSGFILSNYSQSFIVKTY